MTDVFKNFHFPDHYVIRKKDSVKLCPKDGIGRDIELKKGQEIQMIKDPETQLPLSVCLIWDYKERGWRLHESCAPKGTLGI